MKSGVSSVGVAVTLGLALVVTSIHGEAQRQTPRRGGPRDWSHGRVIATRFGPDLDRNLAADWRTQLKHARLETARARREAMMEWLNTTQPSRKQKASAEPEAPHLDWNLRTGGYGYVAGYPAKYSFDISASNCSDVIYFPVDQAGAASIVNLIAIRNPYAGCPGNAAGATPTVKFGLRLPYGVPTSPVPNIDGTILYVIESRPSANGGPILHAINVNNITTTVGTYNFGTTNWSNAHTLVTSPTGTASEQLFQLTYAGVTNTLSSPYLDYWTNQLFFGDSAGRIHRVTNVDTAAAAKDTTNFPVQCGTTMLQSPVFWNGQIIVSSFDGRLYRIDTTVPPPYTCVASALTGTGSGGGGLSAPVLDVSNNKIIVQTNDANGSGVRRLFLFDLMFASGASYVSGAYLGAGSTTIASTTSPSFDDAFWSTNNGNIYAVGAPTSGAGTYLIRVPYNGSTLGTPSGFATLFRSGGAETVYTSPVTEFLTASSLANPDFVFVGGATTNYRYINRISSGFGGGDGTPVAMDGSFQPVGAGGVYSGIIIDTNTTAVTGSTATANVYFGTVGVASTLQSYIVQLAQQF